MAEDNLKNSNILIVDDAVDTVVLLENILRTADYTNLKSTTDAREVPHLYTEFQPDLILLDLMMPCVDGFQVLEQIRSQAATGIYPPILVLTADNDPVSKEKALSAGANDFLTKPFDITEVLLRIHNLLEARFLHLDLQRQNERLYALSQRLLDAQETERRHLAHELHDEIGQTLTALNINLHSAKSLSDVPTITSVLEESIALIAQILQQVRELSRGLRPSMLDELGLVAALQAHVSTQAQRAGCSAHFEADAAQIPQLEEGLSPAVEIACFRVAQEALTNIVRHARARHIDVRLGRCPDGLEIVVRDDGVGFDVPAARERATRGASMGLLAMEERAQLLRGQLEIKSIPIGSTPTETTPIEGTAAETESQERAQHGTEIRACFPLAVSSESEGSGR